MYVKLKHASEHKIIIAVVNLICLSVIWFNHDKILVYHYLGAFPVLGIRRSGVRGRLVPSRFSCPRCGLWVDRLPIFQCEKE